MTAGWYRRDGDDLLLFLRIQPRAKRNEFSELLDGSRKLRLKAPPVDGKANSCLIDYLAKCFGIAKNRVIIEAGLTSRNKRVRIRGTTGPPEDLKD